MDVEACRRLYESIADPALKTMLEVRDKEQSVLKLYQMIPGLRPVADRMGAKEHHRP